MNTCLPLVRDDVSMRFLFLPSEHDPDSYIKEYGAEAFKATVAEAVPLSRFMLDELASRHAMHEAEGRAACVHEAKPLLALLPESTLRVQIEREFAKLVQLTPEELAQMIQELPAQASPAPSESSEPGRGDYSPHPGGDEPPGFMDVPNFDPGEPHFYPGEAEFHDHQAPGRPRAAQSGTVRPNAGRRGNKVRTVTPMAKRLLRLLLAHPELVATLGDQQLEILEHGPHLVLVRDLITLANLSGARHAGALLQAADPGSDLQAVLDSLTPELLAQEDLPDPQAEWNDALRRIELEAIKAEQSALVEEGMKDEFSRKRYQELTRRIALLHSASSR